ncbi:CorA family divalent cation transporter [Ornithinibacillus halophilus]|uniref:CorA-like Mg2+ transporter protein n=1 Tax=Ornithinibacillus halophilus TaxID=930117 RepID=A0A1M5JYR6_9BACI|nr:CorA family divalent cation transporter [Ornithinibacillus halophilus]SHG45696.1 CorA-like Mg2+ transporter protein [Ornithinibacillus halophilus]
MQSSSILKDSSIVYRIEPFYFKQNNFNRKSVPGYSTYSFSKQMFYEHIDNLMFLEEDDDSFQNQIAKAFEIDWNQRKKITYDDTYQQKEFIFPEKGTHYEYLVEEKKDKKTKEILHQRFIRFSINNVQLIISETQVGFIVYDLKVVGLYDVINGEKHHYNLTIENYDWAMYYLRKLQVAEEGYLNKYIRDPEAIARMKDYQQRKNEVKKNKLDFEEKKPADPKLISIPIKWTDLTAGLLRELGETGSFSNQKDIGYHSLLFTSAYVQHPTNITSEEHDLFELLVANKTYRVSHGYKETYHKKTTLDDVVRPFDNVMWSLSAEGVSNLVYTVDDKQTMKFFKNTYKNRRETNYYYMYVLALLQKYSLLYFTISTNELLFQSSVYLGEEMTWEARNEELKRTREFQAKMLKFTIHGFYEQVSYHTHYNDLYEQLIKVNRIPELKQELSPKIEAFHQVVESLVHEQNEKEKEQAELERRRLLDEEKRSQEKQNSIIQTITYFLLPATLTTGILGMNIPWITQSSNFFLAYAIFGVTLLTAILSLILNKGIKGVSAKVVIILSILALFAFGVWDANTNDEKPQEENQEENKEEDSPEEEA